MGNGELHVVLHREARWPVSSKPSKGFTLLELLVVLAVIATLVSIVSPRYWNTVDKAQEVVLRENLRSVRTAIDQYYADQERYPDTLNDLVEKRYLRSVPSDPIVESAAAWIVTAPPNDQPGSIYDIRSSAGGAATNGTLYADM